MVDGRNTVVVKVGSSSITDERGDISREEADEKYRKLRKRIGQDRKHVREDAYDGDRQDRYGRWKGIRDRVEGAVEREERARALQAVPRQLELVHRVHVEHVEAGGGAVGRLGQPHEQVLVLAHLEEHRAALLLGVSTR